MTKTIFKTLLSLLILFSISCGDRPTGSDGGGIIGDNKETPQTETPASKDFLNNFNSLAPQYTGKIAKTGESESFNSYSFDENANMTVTSTDYDTGQSKTENYTFWGMEPVKKETAYYYQNNATAGNKPYPYKLKLEGNVIVEEYAYQEISSVISGVSQNTTTEADNWKNNVKGKSLTAKNKYTTIYNYTFESGGNIKETTGSGGQYERTETYYFWGALDNNRVVYYKKHNARDYFGEDYQGEDKEFWEYCGFSFDIAKQEISKYDEYSAAYYNSLSSWAQNNLDSEGNLKPNGSWGTYPLPTTKDIDWNQPTTGTLTTK